MGLMTDYERAKQDWEEKYQLYMNAKKETDKLWHEMRDAYERYLWYYDNLTN